MKKNKFFTLMVISEHVSDVKRYTFPIILLKFLRYSSIVVLIISSFLFYNYIDMKAKIWELDSLREETNKQKTLFQSFATGLKDVKNQMEKIREMDLKLKNLTGTHIRKGQGGSPQVEKGLKDLEITKKNEDLNRIHEELTILSEEALGRKTSLQRLLEFFDGYRYRKSSSPSLWPLKGNITSSFGYRESPFTGKTEFHSGMDISCSSGTPIAAPADGVISYIGYNDGFGRFLELTHGYGITTTYGHFSKITVTIGQTISRGETIGNCGSSGTTTGPHLHYEVRLYGAPINPFKFIL